ncbi:MAG: CotH kinase family protein [Ilumatobacteraceae bacterium]
MAIAVVVPLSACEPGCAPTVPGPAPSTLRRVHVDTAAGAAIVNTEDYVDGTVRVVAPDGADETNAMTTRIRGRGNSTWVMPKKPYRLRLDAAAPLAGMPAARNWALLANYSDKSLVRNRLAMDLGDQVGLDYSPRSEFVELYLNGAYQGVYELFEHVEIGPDRIPVPQLDPDSDTAAGVITGGYHLEVDHRLDEDVCWSTARGVPICSKDPEFDPTAVTDPAHPSSAQHRYITNYVNEAEAAINTPGDSYAAYFDVDAMVDWYLVSELMKNTDSRIAAAGAGAGGFTSSVFLYKDRGGKLEFGPLWDFDIAAGNTNYNGLEDPTGWWIRESDWHAPLFAHSSFGREVFTQWCQLRRDGVIAGIPARIDSIVAEIGPVAVGENFERWPILGVYVWPNAFVGATHQEEVDYLKTWLATRADWMHTEYTSEFGACPAA